MLWVGTQKKKNFVTPGGRLQDDGFATSGMTKVFGKWHLISTGETFPKVICKKCSYFCITCAFNQKNCSLLNPCQGMSITFQSLKKSILFPPPSPKRNCTKPKITTKKWRGVLSTPALGWVGSGESQSQKQTIRGKYREEKSKKNSPRFGGHWGGHGHGQITSRGFGGGKETLVKI